MNKTSSKPAKEETNQGRKAEPAGERPLPTIDEQELSQVAGAGPRHNGIT
jgi:hypothetical protein